ncbi:extracellular solute-binding protein [Aquabacter spiritensis]|uniref:Peptide/nickel transport system substrate-binding protein n=1 Tax=Aquabacter spiritensis TaxID=933073 RepID=A0A4V2UWU5_9HYPH|nr:extracellular solute-binding protein [Aquabacter spiritensis]TCT00998.1 peptide/nickel transport system substrate-binding protein [Aquabacter spiritensis]
MIWGRTGYAGLICAVLLGSAATGRADTPRHAIAMHGQPALPDTFTHFPYVDPAALKGGRLTLSLTGTFDSLNPFIIKGSATGFVRGTLIESLMVRSYDEPFTLYGLLARTVETDPDRSYVEFRLDPRARFSDGTAVTAQDVLFSWDLLREKGRPNHRLYYGKVARAEATGPLTVRFTFAAPDREMPLIMGLLPVLARHATDRATFDSTSLAPLLGSGPYVVRTVDAGASVTLVRNPDYWGAAVPAMAGLYNFAELRFDYYRDATTEFEAFKRGLVDARFETDPARWQSGYDFAAVRSGDVIRETIPTRLPRPHYALVFNTRRPLFADVRVRRAIRTLFDFDWINRNLFHGLYARTGGFFDGSDLSALGRPASPRERALLAPFAAEVRPDVMAGTYAPPKSDGSGRDRGSLRTALDLLAAAGWRLQEGRLVNAQGDAFAFEIMVTTREQERLCLAFASQLARAGIAAQVRMVDPVQFDARRSTYAFDMVPFTWVQSLSPGTEQAFYFGSDSALVPGTRNYMGMRSPAADALIARLSGVRDQDDLEESARALDRVLISGAYDVPLFHPPGQWLARWRVIARPTTPSLYGTLPETWWRIPD